MMPVFVLLAASVTDRLAAAIIGKAIIGIGIFAMVAINMNIMRMVTMPLLVILLVLLLVTVPGVPITDTLTARRASLGAASWAVGWPTINL